VVGKTLRTGLSRLLRAPLADRLSALAQDVDKQALVERGASDQRIEAVGYGETRPIADNGTPAGRDRNRRIEVYLIEEAN
jgi:flagellar motor protein MotB